MSAPGLDPTFSDLPHRRLGDVALARAQELGASHADFRLERIRYQYLGARDGILQTASDAEDLGFAVRVVHGGAWGFASGVVLTDDEARRVAETAVAVAKVAAAMTTTPVELAPEPVHDDVTWISRYDINPLEVPTREKADLLVDWTERLRTGDAVAHATAFLQQVQENKYYADLAGTRTTQQRVRLQPGFEATGEDEKTGIFDSMASIAPPAGRGWEYLTGAHWDWDAELAAVPELLAEKLVAPSVEAGAYDLVVDPSNLWLTIHESIGHATELDRALGYEANYAGTSFATYDKLGTLQYGSPVMNVQGDRTQEHGLVHRRLRRRGRADPALGHRPRRSPRRLPARPLDGAPQAGAQRRPLQRVRVRRLVGPHPDPADGQRLADARHRRPVHRRPHLPGRTWHLRRG